jgi:hypothetical protein
VQPTTGRLAGVMDEIQHLESPNILESREKSLNMRSGIENGIESQSGEDEPKEDVEEQKLIDDVYDVNAVKSNYELQSLRKDWFIDYMALMEMRE